MTIQELIKQKESTYKYFTENESLKAVEQNGYALQYVKNQTEAICLKAVEQDGDALQYVQETLFKKEAKEKFTISDEVLFEQATVEMESHYGYGCETEIDAYFRGAKWILKQFENK